MLGAARINTAEGLPRSDTSAVTIAAEVLEGPQLCRSEAFKALICGECDKDKLWPPPLYNKRKLQLSGKGPSPAWKTANGAGYHLSHLLWGTTAPFQNPHTRNMPGHSHTHTPTHSHMHTHLHRHTCYSGYTDFPVITADNDSKLPIMLYISDSYQQFSEQPLIKILY